MPLTVCSLGPPLQPVRRAASRQHGKMKSFMSGLSILRTAHVSPGAAIDSVGDELHRSIHKGNLHAAGMRAASREILWIRTRVLARFGLARHLDRGRAGWIGAPT